MSVAGGLTGVSAQVQQILAYWRTRIEAIRSQWLGKLGAGGLVPKPSALVGFLQPQPQPTVRRVAPRVTAKPTPAPVAPIQVTSNMVGVEGESYDMTQKILVPGEKYDFSYKSRRVGTPGERYDFTY